jgi:hypothetical protein
VCPIFVRKRKLFREDVAHQKIKKCEGHLEVYAPEPQPSCQALFLVSTPSETQHVHDVAKTWMPATSAGMTEEDHALEPKSS